MTKIASLTAASVSPSASATSPALSLCLAYVLLSLFLGHGAPYLASLPSHFRHGSTGRFEIHLEVEDDEGILRDDSPSLSLLRFAATCFMLPASPATASHRACFVGLAVLLHGLLFCIRILYDLSAKGFGRFLSHICRLYHNFVQITLGATSQLVRLPVGGLSDRERNP